MSIVQETLSFIQDSPEAVAFENFFAACQSKTSGSMNASSAPGLICLPGFINAAALARFKACSETASSAGTITYELFYRATGYLGQHLLVGSNVRINAQRNDDGVDFLRYSGAGLGLDGSLS
jgi:hypothetical protein